MIGFGRDQRRARGRISGLGHFGGKTNELSLLSLGETGEDIRLDISYMGEKRVEKRLARISQGKHLGATIFLILVAGHKALGLQPFHNAANRGTVMRDHTRQRCLINARRARQHGERGKLRRGQVVPKAAHPVREHGNRDLLQTPYQMARHRVDFTHGSDSTGSCARFKRHDDKCAFFFQRGAQHLWGIE